MPSYMIQQQERMLGSSEGARLHNCVLVMQSTQ